jgi:hypothetical protein
MSTRSALSRSWGVMGLAVLSLAVAGCSGGTPLRFALSSINGVAFSPRKQDGGQPLAGATVSVSSIGSNGALTPVHVSGPITTDAAGIFAVKDLLPGQTVVVQAVGPAPTAQDTANTPISVSGLVPLPLPPASDQPPPAVAATLDLV